MHPLRATEWGDSRLKPTHEEAAIRSRFGCNQNPNGPICFGENRDPEPPRMPLTPETPIFLQLPLASSERVLNPGEVMEVTAAAAIRAWFDDTHLPLEEASEVLVYFAVGRDFVKQQSVIRSLAREGTRLVLDLTLIGEPISADQREHYRASAYQQDVFLSFADGSETCDVVDVSGTGIAVYSDVERVPGSLAEVTVSFEGEQETGEVSVQSVRRLGGGRFRYGMHCVEAPTTPLRRMLLRVNMTLQRRMLNRLAGRT